MAQVGKDMDTILEQYPAKPEYLIFLLQDIQSSYGYISQESMQQACDHAGVPPPASTKCASVWERPAI